ncbi:MAG: ORF3 [Etatorquevirus sp.]|nr:MAG: ORF3 [Etatorquevirus sp.]
MVILERALSPSKILKPLRDLLYIPGTPVPRDFSPNKPWPELYNRVQKWRSGEENPGPNELRRRLTLKAGQKRKAKRVKLSKTANLKRQKLLEILGDMYSDSSISPESSSHSSNFL